MQGGAQTNLMCNITEIILTLTSEFQHLFQNNFGFLTLKSAFGQLSQNSHFPL